MSTVRWLGLLSVVSVSAAPAWTAQPSLTAVEAYQRAAAAVEQRGPLPCSAEGDRGRPTVVRRLPAVDADGSPVRPDGALVHHWWAAILVPHVQSEDVVAELEDYDHHASIFTPDVRSSKLLDREGERYHVLYETLTHNVITVGLKIDSIVYWSGDEQNGYSSHSTTTRVTEFERPGTPRARERSLDEAKGWIWALDSWWHVTPDPRGACVSYEMLALTRDIPWGLGWLLRPIAEHFPADTLTNMLLRTRSAAESRTQARQPSSVY